MVTENTVENTAPTNADVVDDCAEHVPASSDESTLTPRADSKNSAASEPQHEDEVRGSERQSSEAGTAETRVASDGNAYTLPEFIMHYGEELGQRRWNEATTPANIEYSHDAAEPSQHAEVQVANEPVTPAPVVMDAGLLAAFDALPENLRESMQRFVEACEAGSRLKLPAFLKAKQRKAVHLWAEAQGLGHRSLGWASRRRLHLSVAGTRSNAGAQEAGMQREEAFDWAAWADSDQEENDIFNEQASEEGSDREEW
jgi:hypothetical protein